MPENNSQEFKIEALKKAYVNCFSTKSGKEILKDLEIRGFYHASTISKEPLLLAFHEGQRSIVLHIKSMMNFDITRIKELISQQESEE